MSKFKLARISDLSGFWNRWAMYDGNKEVRIVSNKYDGDNKYYVWTDTSETFEVYGFLSAQLKAFELLGLVE